MNEDIKEMKTILIIDDELPIRKSVRFYLEDAGYKVLDAENGLIGLEVFFTEKPDVVLLDLRMPEVDGLEVLAEITKRSPDTPIIVISGAGVLDDVVTALRLGAWDYLTKPIEKMSMLLYAIQKTMERARLIKENRSYQQNLEKEVEERTRELQAAYSRLQSSEEKYRTIYENLQDVYFETCLDGTVLEMSPSIETVANFKRDEIIGTSILNLYVDPVEREKVVGQLLKRGKVADGEINLQDKDGKVITFSITAQLIRSQDGTPEKLCGTLRDISDRKRAELEADRQRQQLQEADKMISLGILVAGVAHEINNPNNFIMLNEAILRSAWVDIQPILDDYFKEKDGDCLVAGIPYDEMRENIPELLDGIGEGAERIKTIVLNLKDYAKRDNDSASANIDVNEVLKAALTLMANPIKKCTSNFKTDFALQLPQIVGNFQRVEQVLINVIQNACQALPDQSNGITISSSFNSEKNMVAVVIEDEGMGISKEHIKHILDPFFTTKRDTGGTGLGLSISAGIMQEHGGRFEIESEVGKGTKVTLLFPVKG